MPISTEIDKSRKLTVYTVTGQVSLDEILNSLEGFYESPEVTLNVLWDGRNAKLKPLSLVDWILILTAYEHFNAWTPYFSSPHSSVYRAGA